MYKYHCLNPISNVGLEYFPGKYENRQKTISNKQTYPCINCTNTGMQGYFFESLY